MANLTVRERMAMVQAFMRKFDQPVADTPRMPTDREAKFWAGLVLEEALELCAALGVTPYVDDEQNQRWVPVTARVDYFKLETSKPPNLVEVVDALRDLEYGQYGTEIALGLHEASDDTFQEVHRSNMAKVSDGDGTKTVKPYGWKPPDIRRLLVTRFSTKALLFR